MRELFFIFSIIIGLGLLVYFLLISTLKSENNENMLNLDKDELDELKFMLDAINVAGPATKFTLILILGGTLFSTVAVFIINLPFYFFDKKKL